MIKSNPKMAPAFYLNISSQGNDRNISKKTCDSLKSSAYVGFINFPNTKKLKSQNIVLGKAKIITV